MTRQVQLQRSYWLLTHLGTRDLARVKLITEFIDHELAQAGPAFWQEC